MRYLYQGLSIYNTTHLEQSESMKLLSYARKHKSTEFILFISFVWISDVETAVVPSEGSAPRFCQCSESQLPILSHSSSEVAGRAVALPRMTTRHAITYGTSLKIRSTTGRTYGTAALSFIPLPKGS